MDPNSNTPPTNPVPMPQPDYSAPQQPAPEPTPEQPAPNNPVPPQPMNEPFPAQPDPVPQPMFSPMTPPMPGQPMVPMPGQPFKPMANSQMPQQKSKKKLIIIGGVVGALVIVGVGAFIFASKAALIGSLSSESYEGLNYKRPASWIKDASKSNAVTYHPKTSLGKNDGGQPTYALQMNVSAQKDVFHSVPDDLNAGDKAALQKIIDQEIDQASSDILPSKYDVGCDDNPVFKDKPKKIDIKDSFLAVKYSFTCKSGTGSNATTFYYSVLDVVPNNKDIEYVVNIGAASESIYTQNLTKIDDIVTNVSF